MLSRFNREFAGRAVEHDGFLASLQMPRITVDPATRIEVHAKTSNWDDQGHVAGTEFMSHRRAGSRNSRRASRSTRCPGSRRASAESAAFNHLLASSKACDAIMAVRVPHLHPAWIVPGGVATPLAAHAKEDILSELPKAKEIAERTIQFFKGALDDYREEIEFFGSLPSMYAGLVDAKGGLQLTAIYVSESHWRACGGPE
jgi:coenzyme F420-reducing hydrogenase alpha subunit